MDLQSNEDVFKVELEHALTNVFPQRSCLEYILNIFSCGSVRALQRLLLNFEHSKSFSKNALASHAFFSLLPLDIASNLQDGFHFTTFHLSPPQPPIVAYLIDSRMSPRLCRIFHLGIVIRSEDSQSARHAARRNALERMVKAEGTDPGQIPGIEPL